MVKSRVHPRIQQRFAANLAHQRVVFASNRTKCIVTLEQSIDTLKQLGCPSECDKVDSLLEVYEWALDELKETDVDAPLDAERIASVGRLLQRMSYACAARADSGRAARR